MSSADPSSASPPSAPPRPRPRLSKRGSFYDAENDKYYLRDPSSAPGHSERAPLHALNGALKEKTVVNERLQRALQDAQSRVTTLEHNRTDAVRKSKTAMAARTKAHSAAMAALRSSLQREAKAAKERSAKAQKKCALLSDRVEALSSDYNTAKVRLDTVSAERERATAGNARLMHQVQVLTKKLQQASRGNEDKRGRVAELEQAVMRLGSRVEATTKENKRLREQQQRESKGRADLMEERGDQLTALAAQLEKRTTQLGAVEYEKAQSDATIAQLRAEIASYRDVSSTIKASKKKAMASIEAAVDVVKKQLDASENRRAELKDANERLAAEVEKGRKQHAAAMETFRGGQENLRLVEEKAERTQIRLENEIKANADLQAQLREANVKEGSELTQLHNVRGKLEAAEKERADCMVEKARVAESNKRLEAANADLKRELQGLQERLLQEEVSLHHKIEEEKSKERILENAVKASVAERQDHDSHHREAAVRICRRMNKLRKKCGKAQAVVRWLSAHNRSLKADVSASNDQVEALRAALGRERRAEDTGGEERAKIELDEAAREKATAQEEKVAKQQAADDERMQRLFAEEQARQAAVAAVAAALQAEKQAHVAEAQATPAPASSAQATPAPASPAPSTIVPVASPMGSPNRDYSSYIDEEEEADVRDETLRASAFEDRPGVSVSWEEVPLPSGDAEGFLQSFIKRANSLRDAANDLVTHDLVLSTKTLVADIAERIAIETYDSGEYLYDISMEMQPSLEEAKRLRLANSNAGKIAEIKNESAAVASVAQTRVRAALHLSRDGMLSWLLTIFGNAIKLLAELETPGQVNEEEIDDGDMKGKAKAARSHAILAASSEELIRICSEQWTKRRWPHTDPNANMLDEVRADVQVAAEEEYWRRYVETVRGKHVGLDNVREEGASIDEPDSNVNFWKYLDPLPAMASLRSIERHIWALIALVNHQQVTETLGEVRLRRYDVHRKLIDTALYAAILRFVGHGQENTELNTIPKAAGRISPERKWMERRAAGRKRRPGAGKNPPFVSATRRNSILGQEKPLGLELGPTSSRIKPFMNGGSPMRGAGKTRSRNRKSGSATRMSFSSKNRKNFKVKIQVKTPMAETGYRGRGGKSPSSGSKALQKLLRSRGDADMRKMMRNNRLEIMNDDDELSFL
jgi:hypothetical protein